MVVALGHEIFIPDPTRMKNGQAAQQFACGLWPAILVDLIHQWIARIDHRLKGSSIRKLVPQGGESTLDVAVE
jgi:hypothetical protein